MNGDDAAAAGDIIGRFDAFDDGVGRAAGGEVTGFNLVGRVEFRPRFMEERDKESPNVVDWVRDRIGDLGRDVNLLSIERGWKMISQVRECGLIVCRADDQEVCRGAVLQSIGSGYGYA